MITLMNNTKADYLAHPMFWAPFVLVGEGAHIQSPKAWSVTVADPLPEKS